MRTFYIPENTPFQTWRCRTGDAIAYTWAVQGSPRAVAFLGRSDKPLGPYRFANEQKRRKWIADTFAAATEHATRKAAVKAEKAEKRAAGHDLKVGDVLRSSWGYDQTNIDYYEITKLVGSQTVEYRSIARESLDTGHMQGKCVPCPGKFTGEAKRARVSLYGNRDSIKIASYANAYRLVPTIVAGMKVFPADHWTAYA